ncbi:MAG: DUF1513 domain-containing protein [Bdellovibrionales bacterium]
MQFTRRHFLQAMSALAASAVLHPAFASASVPRRYVTGTRTGIASYNFVTGQIEETKTGFLPHSFVKVPGPAGRIWAIEKFGSNGAIVDVFQRRVIRHFKCPEPYVFYGHGTCQGERLLVASRSTEDGSSSLLAFNPESYKVEDAYHVIEGGVHDVQTLPDGSMLVAASEIDFDPELFGITPLGQEKLHSTGLVHLDVGGAFLKRILVDAKDEAAAHFLLTGKGIIGLTMPWGKAVHGNLYYAPTIDETLYKVAVPEDIAQRFVYEFLSGAVDPATETAALTNPKGGQVILLDSRTGEFKGAVQNSSNGIVYNPDLQRFVTSDGGIKTIDSAGGTQMLAEGRASDGSHGILI